MTYKRKTRHDYDSFNTEVQEMYLCRRYQLGYYKAGNFLKKQFCVLDLFPLYINLAIGSMAIKIARDSLKKSGVLK